MTHSSHTSSCSPMMASLNQSEETDTTQRSANGMDNLSSSYSISPASTPEAKVIGDGFKILGSDQVPEPGLIIECSSPPLSESIVGDFVPHMEGAEILGCDQVPEPGLIVEYTSPPSPEPIVGDLFPYMGGAEIFGSGQVLETGMIVEYPPPPSPGPIVGDFVSHMGGAEVLGSDQVPEPGLIMEYPPPPSPEPIVGELVPMIRETSETRLERMDLEIWQWEFRYYNPVELLRDLRGLVDEQKQVAINAGRRFDRTYTALTFLIEEANLRNLVGEIRDRFIEWFLYLGFYVDNLPNTGLDV